MKFLVSKQKKGEPEIVIIKIKYTSNFSTAKKTHNNNNPNKIVQLLVNLEGSFLPETIIFFNFTLLFLPIVESKKAETNLLQVGSRDFERSIILQYILNVHKLLWGEIQIDSQS